MGSETTLDSPAPAQLSARLVSRASSVLGARTSRRGFLTRSALVGSALAVAPVRYVLRPGTAYASVCNCSGQSCNCGAACCDGYTEFCCTLTGENTCPPGTAAGGWWKADAPGLCGSSARYYLDCNVVPGHNPCGCGCANGNCGHRKACCTRFRYGQCHHEIPVMGAIMCRVVTCTPPWEFDPSCTTQALTDNNTRFHNVPCLQEAEWGRAPAITATPDGRLHVFLRGRDAALWQRTLEPAGWGAWSSVGGQLSSAPEATTAADGTIHVMVRGMDNAMWSNRRPPGGGWVGWGTRGGVLTSAPGACGLSDGRVQAYVRGTDNGLWRATLTPGSGWSGWQRLGGVLTSGAGPAAAGRSANVFVRGSDRALWGAWTTPAGWFGWYSLGGTLASGPTTCHPGPGQVDVFALGTDGAMWANSLRSSWSGWYELGGLFTSDPDCTMFGGQTVVVGRGGDGRIWGNTRTGATWSGWWTIEGPP
jgi:hypothetical protein